MEGFAPGNFIKSDLALVMKSPMFRAAVGVALEHMKEASSLLNQDLSTDEGVLKARAAQAELRGAIRLIENLRELSEADDGRE